jgi:tetratricopeptide (TPR) repeat protein
MAGSADGFSAREAARITGLSVGRVRRLERDGLLRIEGASAPRFSFGDLLLLRQVKRLLDAGVPLRRISHAYTSLTRRGDSLTRLLLSADSGSIVAANEGVRWDVGSGQLILPYAAPHAATRAVFHLKTPPPGGRALTADQWYELGVDLEPGSITGAIEAYTQAVAQEDDFVEAHINLGRLLHITGSLLEAKKHYERALRLDPLDPIPAFNLGVVLEDLGFGDEALRSYRTALRRDPDFADAHYNLALVYERKGSPLQALKHARRYRELTGAGTGETQ